MPVEGVVVRRIHVIEFLSDYGSCRERTGWLVGFSGYHDQDPCRTFLVGSRGMCLSDMWVTMARWRGCFPRNHAQASCGVISGREAMLGLGPGGTT